MHLNDQKCHNKKNSTVKEINTQGPIRLKVKSKLKFLTLFLLSTAVIVTLPVTISPALAITKSDSQQAEKDYEKALISFHGTRTKDAKIHLKNSLKANPRHLPSRILMAEILIREGDGAGAEVELNFARERGADYDQLIVLFGHAYVLQGKNKYLLDVIQNGNRDNNIEAEISYLRGRAYFGYKKLANAKRSYTQALDRNPLLYDAKLGLAQVAAVHKQYGLALQYIDSILAAGNPNPNAYILKAKIYKQRGLNQKALKAINQAIDLDDSNVLSRLTRAALYIDVRNYEEADEDVEFILGIIPREPRAKYLKAIIAAAQGDTATSKANMTEIINTLRSIPPSVMQANPTYYYLAGLTNFQFGNLDEARENLQQYLKLERNDIGAMRLLGALELQAGDPMAANVVLSEAARNQPNNPTILTMLGLVYLELGNVDKANYYLESVIKLLPESSEGLTNLARGRMAAGAIGAAIESLLKAEQHNLNSVEVKLLLAKAYQQSKQYDKAVAIIGKLKDREPDNPYLLNLYGTAIGLAGDHGLARKSYLRALKIDKDNLTSLIHLSRMDVIENNSDKALTKLRDRLKGIPDNHVLMLELGNTYKILKDGENALFWYKKAYSINGNDFATLNKLVEGYLMTKNIKAALTATTDYLDRFPRHSKAYSLQGKLYERANEAVNAIKSYKLAVEYAIKRGDALLTLANAQIRNNNKKSATKTLQKALAWNPDLTDAYIALIKISIDNLDSVNGFALLKHLKTLTKANNPAVDILSGNLYEALKDYVKAEKSYRRALKIGDNPVATMGLYRTYQQSGKMTKAIAILENWHDKYPEDLRSALALGNAYKRDGQIRKSVTFHDKLLKINPGMAVILNNAASVNFTVGNQDKAVKYARQALKAMPENANILDTLAWIESRRGNPEAALPLLRKALVLRFSDPEIKYHLAMTLDQLNRRGEAQKLLIEALASRADFGEKDAAEATLKNWRGK
ncbi:MAG: PEP-CTERM system TPR-repeat protein PrsT [Alphaproteobacteria bacterium]|nr:MAG: PEP-CTERM system TPR-repeat protein PrsT [Alphaproteobacteria bacterium]